MGGMIKMLDSEGAAYYVSKPVISKKNGLWWCKSTSEQDQYKSLGYGVSAQEAYTNWRTFVLWKLEDVIAHRVISEAQAKLISNLQSPLFDSKPSKIYPARWQ